MIELAKVLVDPAIFRFGLALVHFLWQGAALALLTLLVLLCLKRTRPVVRYLSLLAILAAMAAAPVVTFFQLIPQQRQSAPAGMALLPVTQPASHRPTVPPYRPAVGAAQQPQPASLPSSVPMLSALRARAFAVWRWVKLHAPLVALAWAVGVLLLCLRLVWRWAAVLRARRQAVPLKEDRWQQVLGALAVRLRVSRAVQLLESALVSVPAVVGWLRPAVLVPTGALTGLTPEQLEALLAHELAHIRRYDYLINIVQSAIEVLLFYHPAVWWVSHRIRIEREHCCDDVAVGACGSVVVYSRALTELERLRTPMLELVVAASGTPLLARIRRLVVRQDPRGAVPSWLTAVAPVLAVAALVTAPWSAAAPTPVPEQKAAALVRPGADARGAPAGMFAVCTAPGDQVGPDVSGDIVVWTDYRNDPDGRRGWVDDRDMDILGYDLGQKREFAVCAEAATQMEAVIDGNIVVWTDFRNDPDGRMSWDGADNPDIYGRDLSTGKEFAICLAPGDQVAPHISGDLVVWADERARPGTGTDIWGYSLSDGREFPICTARGDQNGPAVSGTVAVWLDYRDDPDGQWTENQPNNPDIYGRDLAAGPEFPVCTHHSVQARVALWEKTVVWSDGRSDADRDGQHTATPNPDIYGYDLAERREFSITTARGSQYYPAISGGRVVYVDSGMSLVIHDLRTGAVSYLMNLREPYEPAIAGDVMVWTDHRDEAKSGLNIYGYRLP